VLRVLSESFRMGRILQSADGYRERFRTQKSFKLEWVTHLYLSVGISTPRLPAPKQLNRQNQAAGTHGKPSLTHAMHASPSLTTLAIHDVTLFWESLCNAGEYEAEAWHLRCGVGDNTAPDL
jgi:hypothetical protein